MAVARPRGTTSTPLSDSDPCFSPFQQQAPAGPPAVVVDAKAAASPTPEYMSTATSPFRDSVGTSPFRDDYFAADGSRPGDSAAVAAAEAQDHVAPLPEGMQAAVGGGRARAVSEPPNPPRTVYREFRQPATEPSPAVLRSAAEVNDNLNLAVQRLSSSEWSEEARRTTHEQSKFEWTPGGTLLRASSTSSAAQKLQPVEEEEEARTRAGVSSAFGDTAPAEEPDAPVGRRQAPLWTGRTVEARLRRGAMDKELEQFREMVRTRSRESAVAGE